MPRVIQEMQLRSFGAERPTLRLLLESVSAQIGDFELDNEMNYTLRFRAEEVRNMCRCMLHAARAHWHISAGC